MSLHTTHDHWLVARYYNEEEKKAKGVDVHVYQGSHYSGIELLKNGKTLLQGINKMSVGFKVDLKVKIDFDTTNGEGVYVALDSNTGCVHLRNYYVNHAGELRPGSRGCSITTGEFVKCLRLLPSYIPELNMVIE